MSDLLTCFAIGYLIGYVYMQVFGASGDEPVRRPRNWHPGTDWDEIYTRLLREQVEGGRD